MGKKKSKPANPKSDVMDKLGGLCEKLDTLIALLQKLLGKTCPYVGIPYTPPTDKEPFNPGPAVVYGMPVPPVAVFYGCTPGGGWGTGKNPYKWKDYIGTPPCGDGITSTDCTNTSPENK